MVNVQRQVVSSTLSTAVSVTPSNLVSDGLPIRRITGHDNAITLRLFSLKPRPSRANDERPLHGPEALSSLRIPTSKPLLRSQNGRFVPELDRP